MQNDDKITDMYFILLLKKDWLSRLEMSYSHPEVLKYVKSCVISKRDTNTFLSLCFQINFSSTHL